MSMLGLEFDRILPFSPAEEFRLLREVPEQPGVYVIRHRRLGLGEAGIAYIGRATGCSGLRGRLAGYFHPGPSQWTNQRILARLAALDGHDIAFRAVHHPKLAELFEHRLLTEFQTKFGRLPPYNRSMPAAPDLTGVRILARGSPNKAPFGDGSSTEWPWESSYVIDPSEIDESADSDTEALAGCDSDAEWYEEDDHEEERDSELTDYDSEGAEVSLEEDEDVPQGHVRPDDDPNEG